MPDVAVLGGGHGAHAVAGDLALAGYKVNLCEHPNFEASFRPTLERGEVEVLGRARTGVAKLAKATTSFREALDGVDVVFLVVPSFGHRLFAEAMAPHLRDGQLVVLMPGNAGTLEVAKVMREMGVRRRVLLAETATLPYGCRLVGPARVMIYIKAVLNPLGALPASRVGEVLDVVKTMYPAMVEATNVLEAAINNPNPVTHPVAAVFNAGRIEYSKGEFYLYREGITEGVVRAYDAVDEERRALCRKLGVKFYECPREVPREDCAIRMGTFFGPGSLMDAGYHMKGPTTTKDRFVTEDVPYGLVFMESLGSMIGVPTPVISSVITLLSAFNGEDYRAMGRTVEKLGIAGLTVQELSQLLRDGGRLLPY
ncbi:MAG: NAD/NADP octopine/nopaline dehydrogenase family protein [Candidatus Nezhaarchaeales archaeon]